METNLTVRVASEEDLEALVRLAVAFRDHLGQSTPSAADFRHSIRLLLQGKGTEFFLACDGQGVGLGYVQCRYRYSAWTSALEGELEDVFVIRAKRRRGVGLQLMEFAIGRVAERGCRTLGLNTNERNEGALALYRRLGFISEPPLWKGGRQLWLQKSVPTDS